jgi:hypothetical protein
LWRRRIAITLAVAVGVGDVVADLAGQHVARHRLALGQPQQVEALRIADQQVAQVLAGGEDLQQRGQASGSRSNKAASASGLREAAKKRSRLFNAMSGSLSSHRAGPATPAKAERPRSGRGIG